MTLFDVVRGINELDKELVIFAKQPWTSRSDVRLSKLDEGSRLPRNVVDDGFDYFLEIFVALEALEVFEQKPVNDEKRVALLIYYAENDAYPDWVYQE